MFSIYNLTVKILLTNKTVIQFLRVNQQMLIRKMKTLNDFHSVYMNLNMYTHTNIKSEFYYGIMDFLFVFLFMLYYVFNFGINRYYILSNKYY